VSAAEEICGGGVVGEEVGAGILLLRAIVEIHRRI